MARRKRKTRKQEHAALLRSFKRYDELLALQGGRCGICRRAPREGERRFAKDHDHYEMFIRGLLCPACNMRLTDRTTVEWMLAAIDYLNDPPARRLA